MNLRSPDFFYFFIIFTWGENKDGPLFTTCVRMCVCARVITIVDKDVGWLRVFVGIFVSS